jgi:hypothetical protein
MTCAFFRTRIRAPLEVRTRPVEVTLHSLGAGAESCQVPAHNERRSKQAKEMLVTMLEIKTGLNEASLTKKECQRQSPCQPSHHLHMHGLAIQ